MGKQTTKVKRSIVTLPSDLGDDLLIFKMALTSCFSSTKLLVACVVFSILPISECYTPCFDTKMRSIPRDHLMYKKAKPLVIGHRGNPRLYQENTLDGFTSLLETNADGFELDIYMTKDGELVVFHDDNTMKLTGVNKTMWETNADELTKIELPESLDYNGNVYNYSKRRPIPMLEDVLTAMKNSNQLMYLEIKPSRLRDLRESYDVGRKVAALVKKMGLVNQASIVSFDPIKSLAAHLENPNIPTGFFYHTKYWLPSTFEDFYKQASQVPGIMGECIKRIPNGTAFIDAIFHTGDLPKAINATFLDMDYKIYDNPLFSNNTFQTLRNNYSPNISAGAWTLYNVKMNKKQEADQDAVVDSLVKQGADRLITDNVYRMLDKLGRPQTPQPNTAAAQQKNVLLHKVTVLLILFYSFCLSPLRTD